MKYRFLALLILLTSASALIHVKDAISAEPTASVIANKSNEDASRIAEVMNKGTLFTNTDEDLQNRAKLGGLGANPHLKSSHLLLKKDSTLVVAHLGSDGKLYEHTIAPGSTMHKTIIHSPDSRAHKIYTDATSSWFTRIWNNIRNFGGAAESVAWSSPTPHTSNTSSISTTLKPGENKLAVKSKASTSEPHIKRLNKKKS